MAKRKLKTFKNEVKKEVKKEYKPKAAVVLSKGLTDPDMGNIKPPKDSVAECSECRHIKGLHYGGKKGWCNTTECKCQEHKS